MIILPIIAKNVFFLGPLQYSPNRFICRGSGGVGNTGLGANCDPPSKTADNFCAQARYLVHVAFATLRRKYSVAPLLQKNIMVSAHNAFQDCPKALEAQMASDLGSESFLKAS